MCGIVGYIGNENCKDIIIDGLKKLEYRGYDSSGIALIGDGEYIFKEKGRINVMAETVDNDVFATLGIGHTRWATHGRPSKVNSHPHLSYDERFILVHNGVIENELDLKEEFLQGIKLVSETDTEILASLMSVLVKKTACVKLAIMEFMKVVKGSYALAIVDTLDENQLYAVKNMSPMLIGVGMGFNMLGSDVSCMIKHTSEFVPFEDMEFAEVNKENYIIYNKEGKIVERDSYFSSINSDDIELGAYSHYMLKEIEEQSAVIRRIVNEYYDNDFTIDSKLLKDLKKADRINIIAAGTSYHAGMVGKSILETMTSKPVDVHIASEFGYNTPVLSKKPFFIFISQSGETADSRVCLKKINELGYKSLTVTNVEGSTLSREATYTLMLYAGPEIAVASTKAYTAQIAVLSIIAYCMSNYNIDLHFELSKAANAIEEVYTLKHKIHEYAKSYLTDRRNCFYIGRGIDYYLALEAALKLKEISYIQTEGFAAGELKHGTIALIEEGVPVIAIVTSEKTHLNTRGNIKEVESRGANTLVISSKSLSRDDQVIINDVHPLLTSLVAVVPTQYLAYYAALDRGLDIDKPRNLAKSVTVE